MSTSDMSTRSFAAPERDQACGKKTQIFLDGRLTKTPGTSNSRSTSAGSVTPRQSSVGEQSDRSPILSLAQALGDPFESVERAPFFIRNTFIDAPLCRPLSLEGFFNERVTHSCPASRPVSFDDIGGPPGLAASRPISFDEVGVPPGLEDMGSPLVDKSLDIVNQAEHDPFYVIRNTFIDTVVQRPLSLEGFSQPREIRSCPTSRPTSMEDMDMELPPGLGSLLDIINEDSEPTPPASPHGFRPHPTGEVGLSPIPPPPMNWAPGLTQSSFPSPPPPSFSPGGRVMQLSLSQMLSEPELGSSLLPSDGSAGHRTGNCKPCAFFHTKGCGNGTTCSFCHLCGPDEKRRRRVEKKQNKRLCGPSGASHNANQFEL